MHRVTKLRDLLLAECGQRLARSLTGIPQTLRIQQMGKSFFLTRTDMWRSGTINFQNGNAIISFELLWHRQGFSSLVSDAKADLPIDLPVQTTVKLRVSPEQQAAMQILHDHRVLVTHVSS